MKKKIWKLCISVSISAFVFFAAHALVQACAFGGYEYETAGYSLFPQSLVGQSAYVPFLFDPSQPYYSDSTHLVLGKGFSSNEEEWVAYLGQEASIPEVEKLVYKSRLHDLTELKKEVMKQPSSLNDSLRKNRGAAFLIRKGDVSATEYLIFAKRCETHTTGGTGYWNSPPAKDTLAMINLGEEAEARAKKEQNPFLHHRYAFQAARLAHYSGRYSRCIELCARYGKGPRTDSYLSRKFQALHAGALKHLGKYAEARYRFALMFDRYYAEDFDFYFTNFAYSTPVAWSYNRWDGFTAATSNLTDSLSGYQFCKTPHEKTVLLFLDAYSGSILEIPALKEIYRLEPGSELGDILLARCITELEKSGFFPKQVWSKESNEAAFTYTRAAPDEIFAVVKECLEKGGLKKKYFWEYAAGHLSYMKKEYAMAKTYFQKALADAPPEIPLNRQVRAMEVLMDMQLSTKLDVAFENQEVENMKWLEAHFTNDDRQRFLYQLMGDRYKSQGDSVKSVLCYSGSSNPVDLYAKSESQPLVLLINWVNKTDKTPFEQQLLKGFRVSINQLHELYGTVLLRQHRLKEAGEEFARAGKLEPLPADPFRMHLGDCHDCDFQEKKDREYTKYSFVQNLLALEAISDKPGAQQAEAAFQAGNAYYNMSYYGNTWMAQAYFRSGYNATDQYYDCSLAAYFYEKARKASKDREFQAKCVFMQSKCEHNAFYALQGPYFMTACKDLGTCHKNDQVLKSEYSDTQFYQEAILECSYFRCFAEGKK